MSLRGFVPFLFLCAPALALPEAYLSLTVKSGGTPGTEIEVPTKCLIPLVSAEHIAKVKAASSGKMVFYQPGIVGPTIKYTAFLKKHPIALEEHSERGSLMNQSVEAQELQDLAFELCSE